jgi:hypothetical protein
VEYADEIRRRLTPETRLAILWIKDAHHRLQAYGTQEVRSIDIYHAVLDQGVRTPAMFDGYLAERQKPARDG